MVENVWLEAQHAVLGSVLIDGKCAHLVVGETSEEDYNGACRTVYKAVKSLFLRGQEIDPVVVNDALGGKYNKFLMDLMDITPTAANVAQYISICKEQSRLTRLQELGRELAEISDLKEAEKLMENANKLMVQRQKVKAVTMEEALSSFYDRHASGAKPDYLDWPIEGLNERLYAEAGDFIIIGGRPSAGKSALSLQLAFHLAKTKRVGFFSLETSNVKLFDRQMASVARIGMDRIKKNEMEEVDWDRLASRATEICARQLEYIDASAMTVSDIQSYALSRRYQVIFVDYLQIIPHDGKDRVQKVAEISMGLHRMAQSTGITVIAMAQLSRQMKGEKFRPPELSDLRESGQIEQDADIVVMLSKRSENQKELARLLRVLKNKEGELGEMTLDFDGQHQTFMRRRSFSDPPPAKRKTRPEPEYDPQQQFPLAKDQTEPVPF